MDISTTQFINKLKQYFKDKIVEASYRLFIEPLELIGIENNELYLKTYSNWSKSVIDERFKDDIKFMAEKLLGEEINVSILSDKS